MASADGGALATDPAPEASAQCAPARLVADSPTTITTPDPDPSNLTLAASPSGDRFLAAWTDGGWTINGVLTPESVWMSLIQPAAGGARSSPAVKVTGDGVCPAATWTGAGFALAWGDGSGVNLQLLDAQGVALGPSTRAVATPGRACPMALLSTASGLVVAWVDGESLLREGVALIAANGTATAQVVLDTVARGVAANLGLAELQGRTYAAFTRWDGSDSRAAVSEIDWSHATAMPPMMVSGFLNAFVSAKGALWVDVNDTSGAVLYESVAGGSLRMAMTAQPADLRSLAADSCGRLVALGDQGFTPGGIATGFFAQSLGDPASRVPFGSVTGSTLVGAGVTLGVLWYSRIGPGVPSGPNPPPGKLSFTTLSWQ